MAGKEISEIFWWEIELGGLTIYMASSKRGAVRVGLCLGEGPDCVEYFKKIFPKDMLKRDEAMNRPLTKEVKRALKGKTVSKAFKLDINLTPFQRSVLEKITLIPFGQTRSYGEVARIIGRPGGARAVGQVMKRNPFPLVFPCHRVIAAKGLGGFSGGLALKRYLIERENILIKNKR